MPTSDALPRRLVQYVLPVFNESASIRMFHAELVRATETRTDLDFGFIYVDDGSHDDSLEHLLALREVDARVTVLSFSRNFGHQIAVTAGLDATNADAVVIMDTDLQDPPEVSMQLIDRWERGGDVVYAQRRSRRDGVFKRFSAWLFYWVLAKLATTPIPRNVGDFRIMDRRVVVEVKRYREQTRFLRGIVAHVGFRQEALLFDRSERYAGETGYPLRKMLTFAADGVLGFSTAPLRMISRVGFAVSGLSVVGAGYVILVRILTPQDSVPGWAFLGVVVLLLSGLQLVMLGVVGSYLGRIYLETQARPLYSLALVASGDSGPAPTSGATRSWVGAPGGSAHGWHRGVGALPIGESLVQMGVVTPTQLEEALARQRRYGGLIGRHLTELAALTPAVFYQALATQWAAPFVELAVEPPDVDLVDSAAHFLERGWLPWRRVDGGIAIATTVPPNDLVLADAREVLGVEHIEVRTTTDIDLRQALARAGVR